MDRRETEPLYKPKYTRQPDLSSSGSEDETEEFRNYYRNKMEENRKDQLKRQVEAQASGKFFNVSGETDDNLLMNTNRYNPDNSSLYSNGSQGGERKSQRYVKTKTTIINVDSRSRDKVTYPEANEFEVELPRTFNNIKSMELSQLEFPNTDAVINTRNRKIYWRNQEDIDLDKIDTVTGTYPIYSIDLRIGSYTATSLESEIEETLQVVKRQNLIGDFHYFDITLDIDTDIVSFLSLTLTQLDNNPFSSTTNTGVVSVNAPGHGYANGETIHILDARQFAGIESSTMNTGHKITVINGDVFTIEVPDKAIDTLIGGGNRVKTGRLAPFQLLWGANANTVAQNIGYALENSSERIDTQITSIEPLYQLTVTTTVPHGFTINNIGDLLNFSGSGTTPTTDGIRVITEIVSATEFHIQVPLQLAVQTQNIGTTFVFNAVTYNVKSLFNYTVSTILITTATAHNFTLSDVGETKVILSNTNSLPTIDGEYLITNVPSTTSLTINGELLSGGVGTYGLLPTRNPLTTYTVPVTGLEIIGSILRLTVVNHGLQVGESIKVNNLKTIPDLDRTPRIFTIEAVSDVDHIDINYEASSFSTSTLTSGEAYIGTGLITVYMPSHGFNKISSITNGASGFIDITTDLDHGLTTGDSIRIMNTDSSPNSDGYYEVTVVDSDTFSVPFTPPLTSVGTKGIVGMSNDFYLYDVKTVGGIDQSLINGTNNGPKHVVRDVIDLDHFTFYANSSYATSVESGGGNVFISSLKHGFSGKQDNTKNDLLNRSINLQGQDYAFLCNKELSTLLNINEAAKDVFARIQLSESPGAVIFNGFLTEPKLYIDAPLANLTKLKFAVKYYDGTHYEFNDLDWSMAFKIVELIDLNDMFNMSSRRGVIDYTS